MTRLVCALILATSLAGCGGSAAIGDAAKVQQVASQLNKPVPGTGAITDQNGQPVDVDALVDQLMQAAPLSDPATLTGFVNELSRSVRRTGS